jgi:hypothetical protein
MDLELSPCHPHDPKAGGRKLEVTPGVVLTVQQSSVVLATVDLDDDALELVQEIDTTDSVVETADVALPRRSRQAVLVEDFAQQVFELGLRGYESLTALL